jgi:hypothetical protein
MTKPVRLQLSRRKGFNLQALSRSVNGLEAVNVARPSQWGNPFPITKRFPASAAVRDFRTFVESQLLNGVGYPLRQLEGKNLACFCKPGEPCHADVLLELANPTTLNRKE